MPITLLPRTHGRPTTDSPSETPAPAVPGRPWLSRLLAGELVLPALAPVAVASPGRAAVEAEAVARALACPDLFVLDAADRTARERVLADLIRAAAGRGNRVLVLSPDPTAADRIAESAASGQSYQVVRALADDENPYRPTPAATRLTSTAVGIGRVEQMKREAALAVSTLEAKLSRLAAAAARLGAVDADRAALARAREALDAEVRGEADGVPHSTALTEAVARLRSDRDAATALLTVERDKVAVRRAELEATLTAARQHLTDGGKKSGLLARLFGKSKPADATETEQRIHDLDREVHDLTDREAKFRAELDAISGRFTAESEQRIADAITSRRAEIDARVKELDDEKDRLGRTPGESRADVERDLAAARARGGDVARSAADMGRRLLGETRVVVGTPGSLGTDPVFEALGTTSPSFDLLVLDHAEELAEPDFARLSPLAGRWVLAGDASFPDEPRPHANGAGSRARSGRPPEPTLLARLARLLDREPWAVEDDRLVFRLVHLTANQRRAAAREPVLDHPHVELRMTAGPGGDPVLAEIAFPASTPVVEAKGFLFAQLGEVLLRPCGECQWHRTADRLTACWPAAEDGPAAWVELEPGVREKVTGTGAAAYTAAVAFDPAAGWDEATAEAWLAAHLPAASAGRVAALPRSARAAPQPAYVG